MIGAIEYSAWAIVGVLVALNVFRIIPRIVWTSWDWLSAALASDDTCGTRSLDDDGPRSSGNVAGEGGADPQSSRITRAGKSPAESLPLLNWRETQRIRDLQQILDENAHRSVWKRQ